MIRLTHHAPVFRSKGGVESVLKHHHEEDARHGIESRFVIYREQEEAPMDRVSFLGINEGTTIRQARERVSRAAAGAPPEVAVHHAIWGLGYWADVDASRRRVLVLHSDSPGLEGSLRLRDGWLDGVLCVSEPLRVLAARSLPGLAPDRIGLLPYPIFPPPRPPARLPWGGRPLVLGYCGRMMFEQKRVERLPALCARLEELGIDYRFEFLGGGPQQPWLEQHLPDRRKFVFHGWQSGEDYWRILGGWDALVFVSDFEGTPISLLEALSQGVVPIYPRIGTGGDDYAGRVWTGSLYEAGAPARAAEAIAALARLTSSEVAAVRNRGPELVQAHRGDHYLDTFAGFVRRVSSAPRVAREQFPGRPWPVDDLPLRWVGRLGTWRRALRDRLGRA